MLDAGLIADSPATSMPGLIEPSDNLSEVLNALAKKGFGVWVVGGAVRDAILGISPHEFDLTTNARPDEVMDIFEDHIPTGEKFGTITVRSGEEFFEVTTLRTEGSYGDGRRPDEVEWGDSLTIDLSRRDFTMNAMAFDVARELLHDPFDGRNDLDRGVLRAVGEASRRLSEDGLRIMRAYRFMDRGSAGIWMPDHELSAALLDCKHMLSHVSVERIWQELTRIIIGENASSVLLKMTNDGIIQRILGCDPSPDEFEWIMACDSDLEVRLAILMNSMSSNEVEDSLRSLKAPKKVIKRSKHLHFLLENTPHPDESRIYRAVVSDEVKAHAMMIRARGWDPSVIESSLSLPAEVKCIVDGDWICERTALIPGKKLGRLKDWLHRIQIERNIKTRDEMERVLCTLSWQHGDEDEWPRVEWP